MAWRGDGKGRRGDSDMRVCPYEGDDGSKVIMGQVGRFGKERGPVEEEGKLRPISFFF